MELIFSSHLTDLNSPEHTQIINLKTHQILQNLYHTSLKMIGKSLAVAVLLSLNLASAGPIVKRSVLSDLQTVYTDVQNLDTSIKNWNGQLVTAIPILNNVNTLETDIKTATDDTNNSGTFDDADSKSIINEAESLSDIIVTTLNDLVAQVRFLD